MKSISLRLLLAGLVLAMFTSFELQTTEAQGTACCPTATVAYQPVVAQPTVAYEPYTGWYPGKLLDRLRMRRWGVPTTTGVPTYTASYSPYTAAYTPTSYTATYAPASYTAAYRPYLTAYAPLATTTTTTVARQVALSPVVTADCCTPCQTDPCACSPCTSCPGGVSQAGFSEPACSSCTGAVATPNHTSPSLVPGDSSIGATVGPPTPQPQLSPDEPAPAQSNYPSNPASGLPQEEHNTLDPPGQLDPIPESETGTGGSSTYLEAPKLFDPRDRTAQRVDSNGPTVEVQNAIYRRSSGESALNSTSYKPARPTQAEIDAEGWYSVPQDR